MVMIVDDTDAKNWTGSFWEYVSFLAPPFSTLGYATEYVICTSPLWGVFCE